MELWLNRLGTNTSDELVQQRSITTWSPYGVFFKILRKAQYSRPEADKIELAKAKRKQVTWLDEDELERLFVEPEINTSPSTWQSNSGAAV